MEYQQARLRNLKVKLDKVSLYKGKATFEQSYSEDAIHRKCFQKVRYKPIS